MRLHVLDQNVQHVRLHPVVRIKKEDVPAIGRASRESDIARPAYPAVLLVEYTEAAGGIALDVLLDHL